MELILIPKDKARTIKEILNETPTLSQESSGQENNPWKDLLED